MSDPGADGPRFCRSCGQELRPAALFCAACGAGTGGGGDAAAPSPTPGPSALPPVTPLPPVTTPTSTIGPTKAALGSAKGGAAPPPAPPAPSPAGNRSLFVAIGAVLIAVLVLGAGAIVLLGGSDDSSSVATGSAGSETDAAVDGGDDASGGDTTETTLEETRESVTSTIPPSPSPLRPVSVTATNERESVNLRCTGAFVAYSAPQLVDGDVQTGWGASSTDGTGQSASVSFAGPRHLTEVGLSPGYLRVGPRQDQGCRDVSAFAFNRFVTQVEYRFDDGTTELQTFTPDARIQTMPVDVVTRTVTITILGTQDQGWDDDTVISEATFEGYVE